jgi:hypothetical protein
MRRNRTRGCNLKDVIRKYIISYIASCSLSIIIRYSFMMLLIMTLVSAAELSYDFGTRVRYALFIVCLAAVSFFLAGILISIFNIVREAVKHPRTIISGIDSNNTGSRLLLIYDLINMKPFSELGNAALNDISEEFSKKNNKPDLFKSSGISFSYTKSGSILVMGLFLFLFLSPALYRIYHYEKDFSPPPSHTLILLQGQTTAAGGDSLTLGCVSEGKYPEIVNLNKRYVDKDSYSTFKIPSENDSVFYYRTAETESFYYFFSTEEASTDTAFVNVLKRPEIAEISLKIFSPSYTKLPVREYEGMIPSVPVYKGSRLDFSITSTVAGTDSVIMELSEGSEKIFSKDSGGSFSGSVIARDPSEYYFSIYKDYGGFKVSNSDPVIGNIEIINDEYPTVNLIYPEDGFMLDETMQIPVFATATDDFEITEAYLFMQKISFNQFTGKEEKSDFIKKRVKNFENKEGILIVNSYEPLDQMRLFPEDKVSIFLRVYDNDEISGPKYTDSKVKTVVLPTLQELLTETEKNYEKQDKSLKEELERNRSMIEKISEMTEKLKMNQDVNWEDEKKLMQLLNDQEEMNRSLGDLEQEIQKNISMMDENSILNEETMKKYMKLQKLVNDLFTGEMKEKLRELSDLKGTEDLDREKFAEFLKDFENQQNQFKEGIEKSIEILEQIRNEYVLDKLIKQISEMITKQHEINDSVLSENSKKEENLSRQNKVEDAYEFFEKDLENSAEEIEELTSKGIVSEVEEKNIKKDLSDIQSSMEKSDNDSSFKKGSEIASKLTEIKDSIENVKKEMMEEQKDKLKAEIEAVVADLILLSQEIEKLKNFSRDISAASPLASDIIKRFDRLKNLFGSTAEKIFDISKRTFFIDRTIIAGVGNIDEHFAQTSVITTNRQFALSYQRSGIIMGNVNKLALSLIDAAAELEKSESPSGLEEMLKKMEELAKMQSQINSQTSSMQMNQGEPGMSQMQEMMQRLAMEQSQLYDALMKMQQSMGQPGKDGNPGQEGSPGSEGSPGNQGQAGQSGQPQSGGPGSVPGQGGTPGQQGQNGTQGSGQKGSALGNRLSDIAGDMKGIEEHLRDKKLDESLIARQNEVMHKLLDAIESVKREKMDNRREGKIGKNKAVDPGRIDINYDQNLRELLIRTLKDGYTNTYKIKIKDYFRELEN